MHRRRRSRTLAFVIAVAAIGASCIVYDENLLLPAPPPLVDAGASSHTDGGEAGDPCSVTGVPPRPVVPDDSAGGELVFALRSVDIGIVPDAGAHAHGLNLDRACTCPGPETCTAWAGTAPHCDDPGGLDVQTAKFLQQFSANGAELIQARVERFYREGWFGLLIRVADYNGRADDPVVSVTVFESTGTRASPAEKPKTPVLDGTDVWYIDPRSVIGTGPPYLGRASDAAAYVSGGVLVANIPVIRMPMSGFTSDTDTRVSRFDLRSAFLVATLKTNERGVRVIDQGEFAIRWTTQSFLQTLGNAADQSSDAGRPMCLGSNYPVLKAVVCTYADILADPTDTDRTHHCTAMSGAVGFAAVEAKLGPQLGVFEETADPCPANLAGDDCP